LSSFQTCFVVGAIVIGVALLGIGIWITGRPLGVLIDDRKKFSLSRLQLALWSWLLISAFVAAAVAGHTMNIDLPPEVWALMGISVGSAAGSVIVKGTKANQTPAATTPRNLMAASRMGVLSTNTASNDASLRDLFCGEELADQNVVDISKVQMFFFTIAVLYGYGFALWGLQTKPGAVQFPQLSASLVTLLAISHAGYLTIKAAPKTPTA
jgi:hypothetical protein